MYEVELKAGVSDVERLRSTLDSLAGSPEFKSYDDIYFNNRDDLVADEKELRLRRIESDAGAEVVLTFKDKPFDPVSKSKPETEIKVSSQSQMLRILELLDFYIDVRLKKICSIYRLEWNGCKTEITLATVPELAASFLEAEIMVARGRRR